MGSQFRGNTTKLETAVLYSACTQGCPGRQPAIMRWKTAADKLTCCKQPCDI